jgi:hypothetical protein
MRFPKDTRLRDHHSADPRKIVAASAIVLALVLLYAVVV